MRQNITNDRIHHVHTGLVAVELLEYVIYLYRQPLLHSQYTVYQKRLLHWLYHIKVDFLFISLLFIFFDMYLHKILPLMSPHLHTEKMALLQLFILHIFFSQ